MSPIGASPGPSDGRPWKGEKFYFKGDDYFEDVIKAIRFSKKSVDFEVYIFEKGVLGDRVLAVLTRAAQRGVRVRLLVDGIGSPDFHSDFGPKLKLGRVRSRVYRRPPSLMNLSSRWLGSFFNGKIGRRLRDSWFRLNRRDHRKLVIVDRRRVWLGGFNVSDEHLESVSGKKAWRDTGLALRGVADKVFGLAFNTAWYDKHHRRLWSLHRKKLIACLLRRSSVPPVLMNATRHLRLFFHRELLGHLRSAHRRIWIITPYFVPTLPVLRALIRASWRGRDVRLILPERSDVPFVRWASLTFFPPLLKAGCRIFEYQRSILHAKTLLADDWALVGSSNVNHRSFLFDLEVDVVVQERKSLKALEQQFGADLRDCREVHLSDFEIDSLWVRSLSLFFNLFRHWL